MVTDKYLAELFWKLSGLECNYTYIYALSEIPSVNSLLKQQVRSPFPPYASYPDKIECRKLTTKIGMNYKHYHAAKNPSDEPAFISEFRDAVENEAITDQEFEFELKKNINSGLIKPKDVAALLRVVTRDSCNVGHTRIVLDSMRPEVIFAESIQLITDKSGNKKQWEKPADDLIEMQSSQFCRELFATRGFSFRQDVRGE